MSEQRVGLAWALASAVGASFMAIPWKRANELGEPAHSVLVLLIVAALGNTLLGVGQRLRTGAAGPHRRLARIDWAVAAGLASFTLLGNYLAAIAVQDLSPALLNLLLRTDLPIIAVVAWFWLGERVDARFWGSLVIAAVGLVVLQGVLLETVDSSVVATGFAIASAACFGLMAVATRAYIHRIDPVGVNAIRLWLAVALWFALNDASGIASIPPAQAGAAALAAIGGPFLGRLALMESARHIEARLSSLVMLCAPVLTLGPAWWLLGDWPASHQLVGGAIVLVGIAWPLASRAPAVERARPTETD